MRSRVRISLRAITGMSTLPVVGLHMSAVRQRFFPAGKKVSKEKAQADIKYTTSQARPGSRRWHALLCAFVISVIFLIYRHVAMKDHSVSPSYAICSRDGPWIYTVDEANSRTQCLVVRDSYIVDTGTSGRYPSMLLVPDLIFSNQRLS